MILENQENLDDSETFKNQQLSQVSELTGNKLGKHEAQSCRNQSPKRKGRQPVRKYHHRINN